MSDDYVDLFKEELARRFVANPKDKSLYAKIHGDKELLTFCQHVDPEFLVPAHIQLIAENLQLVADGKLKRLIINMPPRHGKSQLTTRYFPSWFLGKFPKSQIIITSNSFNMAEDFSASIKDLCMNDSYKEIFPKLKLKEDTQAKSQWKTEAGGVIIGSGIGGQIIGRGADLAIIDDPVKNYEESISETMRENAWNWYRSTLRSRLHPGGSIVIIMQRWHSEDLAGKILTQDGLIENGGLWKLLKLPAIDEKGNPLWLERYPISELMEIRKSVGEKIFQALYQQEPVDITEKLFSDPKFEEPPANLKLFAYLDPALGGKDYSALTIGGVDEKGILYVVDGVMWKGAIDVTYAKVEALYREYNVTTLFCESNQAQVVIADSFKRKGLFVREVRNFINKHLRIMNAVKVNWDKIRFSLKVSGDYLKQVVNYSELAEHDDAPDSLAGLCNELIVSKNQNIIKRYSFWRSI